jgi:hypothetical protein
MGRARSAHGEKGTAYIVLVENQNEKNLKVGGKSLLKFILEK